MTLQERLATTPPTPAGGAAGAARAGYWEREYRCDITRIAARCGSGEHGTRLLAALLDESPDELKLRFGAAPSWQQAWAGALAGDPEPAADAEAGLQGPNPYLPFLNLFAPLVANARAAVRRALTSPSLAGGPADLAELDRLLYPALASRLLEISIRVLVLELNVARVSGMLRAATRDGRFEEFTRQLRDPDTAGRLLSEYPVLARDAVTLIDRWAEAAIELGRRLAQDWARIADELSVPRDSRVVSVVPSGDVHGGGRAVTLVGFESGSTIVYNPRSVAPLARFQELLAWCNGHGLTPPLRCLRVIERDGYGWVEFAERADCRTVDEVERFYTRQGFYLALLHAFGATDFHHENIIAAGEHPILVDLETIIVPQMQDPAASGSDPATRHLLDSILQIGLLPQHAWVNGNADGIDLSGLGGQAGQAVPFARLEWESAATDEMRSVKREHTLTGAANLPRLAGVDLSAADYLPALVAGFRTLYRLLAAHASLLAQPGSPFAAFADVSIRVILRGTVVYGVLRRQAYHPDFLRDALDREVLFEWLARMSAGRPELEQAIPAEVDALLGGDVPLFATRGDSCHLELPDGRLVGGIFAESAFARAARRLAALNQEDLERQIDVIAGSFAAFALTPTTPGRAYPFVLGDRRHDRAAFVDAALLIGRRLEHLALRHGDDAAWTGSIPINGRRWRHGSLGADVYAGAAGIALFLAYLDRVAPAPAAREVARAALRTARRITEVPQGRTPPVGAFSGAAGLIYVLTHLGALWRDERLLDEAEILRDRLTGWMAGTGELDVIAGAAGVIGVAAALHRVRPSAGNLALVRRSADVLVARSTAARDALAWPSAGIPSSSPLTGFSHGAAGMAWALLVAGRLTAEGRYTETARQGIAYERAVFDRRQRNWPDFRALTETDRSAAGASFSNAWCHGAPGIGLSRLRAAALCDDAGFAEEIAAALDTTERGFGANHCLCHGDFGNMELLREAAAAGLYDADRTARFEGAALEGGQHEGWRCGAPGGGEVAGLLIGLAGVGYGLLRCAARDDVPSVLTLDPPPA